jgi:hypothetical protein
MYKFLLILLYIYNIYIHIYNPMPYCDITRCHIVSITFCGKSKVSKYKTGEKRVHGMVIKLNYTVYAARSFEKFYTWSIGRLRCCLS